MYVKESNIEKSTDIEIYFNDNIQSTITGRVEGSRAALYNSW